MVTPKLNEALAKAQAEMPIADMTGYNPHFKSTFSTMADLVKAARPSLTKYGLSVSQTTDTVESKIFVCTTLRHSSGEFLESKLPLIIGKQDMQGLGSALSYGQRYDYKGITGVVSEEDDDGNGAVKPKNDAPEKKSEAKTFTKDASPYTEYPWNWKVYGGALNGKFVGDLGDSATLNQLATELSKAKTLSPAETNLLKALKTAIKKYGVGELPVRDGEMSGVGRESPAIRGTTVKTGAKGDPRDQEDIPF